MIINVMLAVKSNTLI